MINNPYQQYRTTQAETADGGQLVVMLYEGAIRFLTRALSSLENGDLIGVHSDLVKTQGVITELMSTLDLSVGEIATNLFRVYEYMHFRLVEANVKKDAEPVREVLVLLRELLPAWQEAARQTRAQANAAPKPVNLAIAAV